MIGKISSLNARIVDLLNEVQELQNAQDQASQNETDIRALTKTLDTRIAAVENNVTALLGAWVSSVADNMTRIENNVQKQIAELHVVLTDIRKETRTGAVSAMGTQAPAVEKPSASVSNPNSSGGPVSGADVKALIDHLDRVAAVPEPPRQIIHTAPAMDGKSDTLPGVDTWFPKKDRLPWHSGSERLYCITKNTQELIGIPYISHINFPSARPTPAETEAAKKLIVQLRDSTLTLMELIRPEFRREYLAQWKFMEIVTIQTMHLYEGKAYIRVTKPIRDWLIYKNDAVYNPERVRLLSHAMSILLDAINALIADPELRKQTYLNTPQFKKLGEQLQTQAKNMDAVRKWVRGLPPADEITKTHLPEGFPLETAKALRGGYWMSSNDYRYCPETLQKLADIIKAAEAEKVA